MQVPDSVATKSPCQQNQIGVIVRNLHGDGGFAMLTGEMATQVKYTLLLKVIRTAGYLETRTTRLPLILNRGCWMAFS